MDFSWLNRPWTTWNIGVAGSNSLQMSAASISRRCSRGFNPFGLRLEHASVRLLLAGGHCQQHHWPESSPAAV